MRSLLLALLFSVQVRADTLHQWIATLTTNSLEYWRPHGQLPPQVRDMYDMVTHAYTLDSSQEYRLEQWVAFLDGENVEVPGVSIEEVRSKMIAVLIIWSTQQFEGHRHNRYRPSDLKPSAFDTVVGDHLSWLKAEQWDHVLKALEEAKLFPAGPFTTAGLASSHMLYEQLNRLDAEARGKVLAEFGVRLGRLAGALSRQFEEKERDLQQRRALNRTKGRATSSIEEKAQVARRIAEIASGWGLNLSASPSARLPQLIQREALTELVNSYVAALSSPDESFARIALDRLLEVKEGGLGGLLAALDSLDSQKAPFRESVLAEIRERLPASFTEFYSSASAQDIESCARFLSGSR